METALVGSMNYIDIAIIVVLAFGLLIGLIQGFGKLITGAFSGIVAFVLGIALCTSVAGLVGQHTTLDETINAKLGEQIIKYGGEAVTSDIYFNTVEGFPYYMVDGESVSLVDGLEASKLKIVAPIIVKYIDKLVPQEGLSIEENLSKTVTKMLMAIIAFILTSIVIRLILWILSMIYEQILMRRGVLKSVNRVFGGVANLAISIALVFSAFAVVSLFQDQSFMSSTMDMINSSKIGGWIMDNNFIVKVLDKIL